MKFNFLRNSKFLLDWLGRAFVSDRATLLMAILFLPLKGVGAAQIRNFEIEATMTNSGSSTYSITGKTNTVVVPGGKELKCLNYFPQLYSTANSSSTGGTSFLIKTTYEGSGKQFTEYAEYTGSSNGGKSPIGMVFIGPCVVSLELGSNYSYWGGGIPGLPTVFIRFEESERIESSGVGSALIPLASVVVPADATGDVDVILEQSTDMITWTQCLPGTYNASTQKRFFRVRAVEK